MDNIIRLVASDFLSVKNKGEARALITGCLLSQHLNSSTTVLNLSVENELILTNLQEHAFEASKTSPFTVVVCPLLYNATALLKQRYPIQVITINMD